MDESFTRYAFRLLTFSPQILSIYLSHRGDDGRRSSLWHALLRETAAQDSQLLTGLAALTDLAQEVELADTLRPSEDELESAVSRLLVSSSHAAGDPQKYSMLKRILQNPGRTACRLA